MNFWSKRPMTSFSWRNRLPENSEGIVTVEKSNAEIPRRFASKKSRPRTRRGRFGSRKSTLKSLGGDLPAAGRLAAGILRPFALYKALPRIRGRDFHCEIGSDGFQRRFPAGEPAPKSVGRDFRLANRACKISRSICRRQSGSADPRKDLRGRRSRSARIPETFSLRRCQVPRSSQVMRRMAARCHSLSETGRQRRLN